ncbi:MAG: SDR family oxidoreductase [Gemmataceae bacterium]|nr:SDR family oxidoreductase [Gemmataceae bacterium]
MAGKFAGKTALITGGSSGIGLGIALELCRQGARLALLGRNPSKLEEAAGKIKALGGEVHCLSADVGEIQELEKAVEQTLDRLGSLDMAIASAGVSVRSRFMETSPAILEQVMRTNFFGVANLARFTLPHLEKTRGSLVAISSLAGRRGVPEYSAYGASKFAVQGLLDSLRMEVALLGIHVGVVSTGFVDTPLRNQVLGGNGSVLPDSTKLPFRLWPLETCVKMTINLIEKRKREALLPWFVRPLFAFDVATGGKLGDRYLGRKFGIS